MTTLAPVLDKLIKVPTRQAKEVSNRRLPLSEEDYYRQIKNGLYVTVGGERLAIPSDKLSVPGTFKGIKLWERQGAQTTRRGVRLANRNTQWQGKVFTWANEHIHPQSSYNINKAIHGFDIHYAASADLYANHWHKGWTNPYMPESPAAPIDEENESGWGFLEALGWLSGGVLTTVFISFEVASLTVTPTEYEDFDFHEVGTTSAAQAVGDTALTTPSGIARETGTPTDLDPIYQNVATITADATETWEEHGLFNNVTGATLMDRTLTLGQSVNSSDQVQYTYQLTKNSGG